MPLEEADVMHSYMASCTILCRENDLYKPVHQKHPCTLWAMHSRSNYVCVCFIFDVNRIYTGMVKFMVLVSTNVRKRHKFLPELGITKHPMFSGMDELKTDEFLPIMLIVL